MHDIFTTAVCSLQRMGVKLLLLVMFMFMKEAFAQNWSVALPGCHERCGGLVVHYPFGIGANCSAYPTMEIFCNTTFTPPRAFLRDMNGTDVEVRNISVEAGTVQIYYPISTKWLNRRNGPDFYFKEPFTYSHTENLFVAMGCSNLVLAVSGSNKNYIGGCFSMCSTPLKKDRRCYGVNCCQTRIKPSLTNLRPYFMPPTPDKPKGPRYAFVVDQKWFRDLEHIPVVKTWEYVPAVLNWTTNSICKSFGNIDPITNTTNTTDVCGANASCTNQSLCSCQQGYQGNPYLQQGCQDIDECAPKPGSSNKRNICEHICINTPGSYECKEADHTAITVIASCAGLGLLLATAWCLYKLIELIRKRMNVYRNGGRHRKIKLFTSRELKKATDSYNDFRILGQGGQGTVYEGMLTDKRIVAVKKSKKNDESFKDFMNEVDILSQIDNINIVKLHGCCLETKVPLLVYEFIPNGTLRQYIDEHNTEFTWDVRVRVATEVARAVDHLHSIPIYHRDIKSSNILLDDKYTAKLADFGISRSISIGQTHLTSTRNTQAGTPGYLDPVSHRLGKYTHKSDVYSFGVVLGELLTGRKPIQEEESLATFVSSAMKDNRILDRLDSGITKEGREEEIKAFANIACRCLDEDEDGKNRPTMKQVVADLESIRNKDGSPSASAQQHNEGDDKEAVVTI